MKPTVLFIAAIWPEPRSSAAGVRTVKLLDAFQAEGWRIVFVAASPLADNPHAQALVARGIELHVFGPNDSDFDGFVRELSPRVAILDRFMLEEQFGWRVRDHSPTTLRVLDTIDLHFLRRAREQAFRAPEKTAAPGADDNALREVAAIFRSDLALVISSHERELLEREYGVPAELLLELGIGYPPPTEPRPRAARAHFSFIGNFRHPPNVDAVHWLKRELWPRIRARVGADGAHAEISEFHELHVYGAYPPRELMALDDPRTGFRMRGQAADQYETLGRYLVNLAPLRFGAGIKGKIADGWFAGTPAVATSLAAEGMELSSGFGGLIADEADSIATAALDLYENAALWREKQAQGHQILHTLFDEKVLASRLLEACDQAASRLEARRARNFIGQMLWHHQHRSTTYFSKWIELKNSAR